MSAKEIYIPEYITKVLRLLKDGGHEGFLVGGCVRDSLMGKEPHDYDITTSATPDEMKRCFAGEKVIETGVRHGTLTVVSDSNNVEVTTFRVDGEYEDNRHPTQVSFTHRLQDDLSRRDFTVNAMAYSPERGVVDIFDGQKDIERRLIRCVGDPDKRFNEDALRILRALRFSSALDFDIDKNTDESIRKNKGLLKNISSERMYSELVKIILGNGAERVLLSYPEVIAEILPELSDCMGFEQNNPYHCYDVYTHTVKAVCDTFRKIVDQLEKII